MTRMHAFAAGAVALLLTGTSAWAGLKQTWLVGVDAQQSEAWGSIGAARASPDTVQMMGCSLYSFAYGSESASCMAITSAGMKVTCTSTTPAIVNAVRSVTDSSYIFFRWDSAGKCTYLAVSNTSNMTTRQP